MQVVSRSATSAKVSFTSSSPPVVVVVVDFLLGGTLDDLAPLFSGSFWSAMIWQESVELMCEHIASHPEQFAGKTVVELGCGLGVPGMCAKFVGQARRVVLTDRQDDLTQLERTLKHNPGLRDQCELVALDWERCNELVVEVDAVADVILCVECISADAYGRDSLRGLVAAVNKVKKSSNTVVFVCSCRREAEDGLDEVLGMLTSSTAATATAATLVAKRGKAELYRIDNI